MRSTLALIRRELSAYFLSPFAYVILAAFLTVTGYFHYLIIKQLTATGPRGIYFPMQFMIRDNWFWLVFLFIPPLLTMRLLAEERSNGTLEMLLTAPLRTWQIVTSKFIACLGFYVVLWLPTLIYLPVITGSGAYADNVVIDIWPMITTYLGLFLAGAMFLALGLFISSLVKSQIIAAVISFFVGLVFIVLAYWRPEDMDIGGLTYRILFYFTVPLHFERNFGRGLIDTRQIVLYVSVTLFCLFITVRSLESRR